MLWDDRHAYNPGLVPHVFHPKTLSENHSGRSQAKMMKPFSTTHQWKTLEGGLQRFEFAFTFGVAAVGLSAILWIVSVPWVAWCLHRLIRPAVSVFRLEMGFCRAHGKLVGLINICAKLPEPAALRGKEYRSYTCVKRPSVCK